VIAARAAAGMLARMAAPTERPATPSDYDHFTRLFVELTTGDPIPARDMWEKEIAPDAFFLEEGGAVMAYAWGTKMTDTGYIRHVVVAPDARGRGLGRRIMEILARRFREEGCTKMCLNVKPDNTPAIRLYESFGLRTAYGSVALRLKWSAVERLPVDPEPTRALPIDPSEDAELEARYGMPGGRLSNLRVRSDRVLLRVVDRSGATVGLAGFDPRFPGAFPFRPARASLARALLEAMRSHALPEHDDVQVMVEDDVDLARALRDAGAVVRLEMLHLEGPMPA
jgi:GNAT superfamily N-acetyltransferase